MIGAMLMNWKTTAGGACLTIIGVLELFGVVVPGVSGNPNALILTGISLMFASDAKPKS